MVPFGIRLYGLGAISLGVVGIVWGDFALQWQPVAAGIPGRTILAYIFAAALVIAGACVNDLNPSRGRRDSRSLRESSQRRETSERPEVAFGVAALVVLYAVVVIFMHGPQIFQQPGSFITWDGAAEQVALLAGGLAAYAYLVDARLGRTSVIIMGVCLVMFGIAHFLYLDFTASMVPSWLPGGQKFWAIATGVAHLAAGIAFLTGVKARQAAIAVTIMFGMFSLLVHLPVLAAHPQAHMSWVINAINLALTGAAGAIATQVADSGVAPAGERAPRMTQHLQ